MNEIMCKKVCKNVYALDICDSKILTDCRKAAVLNTYKPHNFKNKCRKLFNKCEIQFVIL